MTELDRRSPPPPAPVKRFRFPHFERRALYNGLELIMAQVPGVPVVSLQLFTRAAGHWDPPRRAGLASLTGSLLDEGTQRRTATDIALQVEGLGGYLASGADWNVGYVIAGLLSSHLRTGLEVMSDVVENPTFPPPELDRLRRERLVELQRRRDQAASLADLCFMRAVYAGTPYGHSLLGSESSLNGLERHHCVEFWSSHSTIADSSLVIAGEIDPSLTERLVEELFTDSRDADPRPFPPIDPPPAQAPTVHLVDRRGAAQTELRIGHVGVPRLHDDRIPLRLMNSLLGGKFTSRINLNLRERHGFTYGAHSRFVERRGPGPFLVSTAVANDVAGAATREILGELRRLQDEGIDDDELEETRSYLLGVFPYTLQTVDGVAKHLEELAIYDLPDDYFDSYPTRLSEVACRDVERLAQQHLHPDRVTIVAVGPVEELRQQLEGFGEVTVWSPESLTEAENGKNP